MVLQSLARNAYLGCLSYWIWPREENMGTVQNWIQKADREIKAALRGREQV